MDSLLIKSPSWARAGAGHPLPNGQILSKAPPEEGSQPRFEPRPTEEQPAPTLRQPVPDQPPPTLTATFPRSRGHFPALPAPSTG